MERASLRNQTAGFTAMRNPEARQEDKYTSTAHAGRSNFFRHTVIVFLYSLNYLLYGHVLRNTDLVSLLAPGVSHVCPASADAAHSFLTGNATPSPGKAETLSFFFHVKPLITFPSYFTSS